MATSSSFFARKDGTRFSFECSEIDSVFCVCKLHCFDQFKFYVCAVSQTLTPRCVVMIGKEKETRFSMKLSISEIYVGLFYLTIGVRISFRLIYNCATFRHHENQE